MKRIIMHWTGGSHNVGKLDRKSYHEIFAGSGTMSKGDNPIEANEKIVSGRSYAAHTYRSNTGSIGLSIACMAGAKESPFKWGKYPPTRQQVRAMIVRAAQHCRTYNIPVSRTTVLTHAEVQTNLGIKQKGKWDIICLPWIKKRNALVVGDYLRAKVREEMRPVPETPIPDLPLTPHTNPKQAPTATLYPIVAIGATAALVASWWDEISIWAEGMLK